ncbi:MAG: two-component regulator propeller domain-containing protein [Rhodothermales bacterium]
MNYPVSTISCCLFLLLSCLPVSAQDYSFDTFSMEQGLSAFAVTDIIQDTTGFLWIATLGGLNRYDGYTFETYHHISGDSSTLANNYINTNALLTDGNNNLWIGTRGGLSRLDLATGLFHNYYHSPDDTTSLPDNEVHQLLKTNSGKLWVGTSGGLSLYDPATDSFARYFSDPVRSLAEDESGYIWIGTYIGLYRLDPVSGIHTYLPIKDTVWSLFTDSNNQVWAGASGGILYKIDPATNHMEAIDLFSGLETTDLGGFIIDIYEDEEGLLWVGTWNGGLFIRKNGIWSRLIHDHDDPDSLPGNSISSFFKDRTGKMWVGSWSGLSYVRSLKAFDHLDMKELPVPFSTSVDVTPDGSIWVGTHSGVWGKMPGKAPVVISTEPGADINISNGIVSSVLSDQQGFIWVGTSGGGINRINTRTGEVQPFKYSQADPSNLPSNLIYKIFEDSKGRIWIGTVQAGLGLWHEETGKFAAYDLGGKITSSEVWTIYEGKDGRLWAGGLGSGLHEIIIEDESSFPPRLRFRHFQQTGPGTIASNDVVTMHHEADALWIGTMGGGLNKMDLQSETFTHYDIDDGLPHNNVGCILPGDDGYLWISTNSGISRFDPDREVFTNYTKSDGLASAVFFQDGCAKDTAGKLYFASLAGVTVFDPALITNNPYAPTVSLTDVRLFNKPLAMDSTAAYKQVITLPYKSNFLSFDFSALDFNIPEKNQYAYKLVGLDPDWVTSGSLRSANYPGLQPGNYKLMVKATNNDGFWSEGRSLMHITIKPPYWQTAWFRLLLLSFFLAIGWTIYSYRRSRRNELVQTRQQIADDLHDDLSGNLSALSFFLGRIRSAAGLTTSEQNSAQSYLLLVQRMIGDLHDVIWIADPEFDEIDALTNRMEEIGRRLTNGLQFTFESEASNKELPLKVRRHLFFIYKEAVHNAVRHAAASRVDVKLSRRQSTLSVSVNDNGKGFEKDHIKHGQGFLSMQRRAEQNGISLSIRSIPGNGTTIIIKAGIT